MKQVAFLATLLACAGAAAQRPGCGYGLALDSLRALPPSETTLTALRETAAGRAPQLRDAATALRACQCPRLAEHAADAAQTAETVATAPDVARARAALDRAAFSMQLGRETAARRGCT